jgi:glycosidase
MLRSDLFNWGTWIISILGDSAAGFRFDAIKHIDEGFHLRLYQARSPENWAAKFVRRWRVLERFHRDIFRYLDGFGTQVRSVRGSVLGWYSLNHIYSSASSTYRCITTSRRPPMLVGTTTLGRFGMVRLFNRDPLMQCMCVYSSSRTRVLTLLQYPR